MITRRIVKIALYSFVVLLVSGLALRIESAIRGRQITRTVAALGALRVGETSKAETLSRIPGLKPSTTGPNGVPQCNADECFFVSGGNGFPGRILLDTYNKSVRDLLRWWGFRFEDVYVWVTFKSGKVSYFSYHLTVSSTGMVQSVPPPPSDGELGAVIVFVSSQEVIHRHVRDSAEQENPFYVVGPARDTPSQNVGITLTPKAPEELRRNAFDLKLQCLWSFGGCRRWDQILPGVHKQY